MRARNFFGGEMAPDEFGHEWVRASELDVGDD